MLTVRPIRPADADEWLAMRLALWPDEGDRAPGFAELSIRPYAEGCESRQVAYLEGWYVVPESRRSGVGRALITAAERWGREHGCTEFASDSEPQNRASHDAHLAVGFVDVGLVRCFRKSIDPPTAE